MISCINYLNKNNTETMVKSPSLLTLEEEIVHDSDPSIAFYTKGIYNSDDIEFLKARISEAISMFKNMCIRYESNAKHWLEHPESKSHMIDSYLAYAPSSAVEYAALLKRLHQLFDQVEEYYKSFEQKYFEKVRKILSNKT